MTKKGFFVFMTALLITLSKETVAKTFQSNKPVLRHAPGLQGLEFHAGRDAIGKLVCLEWSYYFSSYWQIKAGIGLSVDQIAKPTYYQVFSQPVVVYTLFHNGKNLFFNVAGGSILIFEDYIKNNLQHFNWGLYGGGELAFFLLYRLELLLTAGPKILFLDSTLGQLDYYLSLGIRGTF